MFVYMFCSSVRMYESEWRGGGGGGGGATLCVLKKWYYDNSSFEYFHSLRHV